MSDLGPMPEPVATAPAKAPVENKVWASTGGTVAGGALTAFTLWILGVFVWGVPDTAAHASDAISAVPTPVAGLVGLVLTAGGSFAAGYIAKHSPRP